MTSLASSTINNNDILESLPPIAPSIGFSRGALSSDPSIDAATNPNRDDINDGDSSAQLAQQTPSVAEDASKTKIPPILKIGTRHVQTTFQARQWAWKSFQSSARHDNATFSHWVRSNIEYADYPYARFDVSLDKLTYTEEEYAKYLGMEGEVIELENIILKEGTSEGNTSALQGTTNSATISSSITDQYNQYLKNDPRSNKILPWTKEETDALMELCHSCDLRWPVIIDKWHDRFSPRDKDDNGNDTTKSDSDEKKKKHVVQTAASLRRVEDLQHRYYQVGNILAQKRIEVVMAAEVAKLAGTGNGVAPSASFPGSDIVGTAATTASTSAQTSASQSLPEKQPPLHPSEVEGLKQTHQQTSLHPSLAPPISIPGSGTSHRGNGKPFDLSAERARRCQVDYVWNRTKEEEREEEELKAELRAVEAQLRKLKKTNRHLVPVGSANAAGAGGVAAGVASKSGEGIANDSTTSSVMDSSTTPHPTNLHNPHPITSIDPYFYTNPEDMIEASFHATAPQPTPGTPYLQSGRLFPPAIGGHAGLNKQTLKQMDAILKELGVPIEPIATKRSMDLYDGVRKDALTLLVLQKMVLKKEAEVISKRTKLIKLTSENAAVEKKGIEKKKTARNRSGTVESSALVQAATGSLVGEGNVDTSSGGGKKSSGGASSKSSKGKRPREDSVVSTTSATQAAAAAAGGATAPSTGKSIGKKGPNTTSRKKSRTKSVSGGTDAKKGSATAVGAPISTVPLEAGGMPGVPPLAASNPPTTMAMAQPAIPGAVQAVATMPAAGILPPPSMAPSQSAPVTAKAVGKSVRPPIPGAAGVTGDRTITESGAAGVTSPGKTGKKRAKKTT